MVPSTAKELDCGFRFCRQGIHQISVDCFRIKHDQTSKCWRLYNIFGAKPVFHPRSPHPDTQFSILSACKMREGLLLHAQAGTSNIENIWCDDQSSAPKSYWVLSFTAQNGQTCRSSSTLMDTVMKTSRKIHGMTQSSCNLQSYTAHSSSKEV